MVTSDDLLERLEQFSLDFRAEVSVGGDGIQVVASAISDLKLMIEDME